MDYQASQTSSKEVVYNYFYSLIFKKSTKHPLLSTLLRALVFTGFIISIAFVPLYAQTTTNPLTEDVTITAIVLSSPVTYPDTRPIIPSGPINQVDMSDVAIFRGLAYPRSTVSLLKNGEIVGVVTANAEGTFELHLRNVNPGTYSFGIRAEDAQKNKSRLLLFTIAVSTGVATLVDGIFIPPTLTSDKVEVKKSESIVFSGTTVPLSELRLSFDQTSIELLRKAKADSTGLWVYTMDSSLLSRGDHDVKVRSLVATDTSPYSDELSFRVGDTTRMRTKATALIGFRAKCDLNNDNRVNLLDFSIMAYWYKRLGFPPKVDLNSDKLINLTDLSILAYCWTG